MRPFVARAFLVSASLCAITLPRAQAHLGRSSGVVETVYVPSVLTVPTTYYASTSYYVPTTYSVLTPTVYTSSVLTPTTYYVEPTAYLVGTSYQTTSLAVRRRLAARPFYTTTSSYYVDLTPTTYYATTYWPTTTTLDLPSLTPTSYTCDPCAVPSATTTSSVQVAPQAGGNKKGAAKAPPVAIESEPGGRGTGAGNTSPAPSGAEPGSTGAEPPFEFPTPVTPTPEKPGSAGAETPVSPPPPAEGGVSAPPEPIERQSYKPTPTVMRPRASSLAPGALRGEVVSGSDNQPQARVKVVFSDLRQRYKDREATSNEQGYFEVVLPDGDWAVQIAETDGKTTPYGTITSAGGRFLDDSNRQVSSLRINH